MFLFFSFFSFSFFFSCFAFVNVSVCLSINYIFNFLTPICLRSLALFSLFFSVQLSFPLIFYFVHPFFDYFFLFACLFSFFLFLLRSLNVFIVSLASCNTRNIYLNIAASASPVAVCFSLFRYSRSLSFL